MHRIPNHKIPNHKKYFVRKYIRILYFHYSILSGKLLHIMFSLFCQEIYIVENLNVYCLLLGIFYD
jgi:hypothetical protein